ncbi:hypothetical protein SAMN04487996_107121 [Dyadobacter soli]|uniref:Uncharacterized protein n=1 Tax=Dyadobacter soli TaxID=659014 RepID=A0A1G7G4M3_9BACT|nr:hypothetical protein SAMN04487996_107121 [Dyadobacter soli]
MQGLSSCQLSTCLPFHIRGAHTDPFSSLPRLLSALNYMTALTEALQVFWVERRATHFQRHNVVDLNSLYQRPIFFFANLTVWKVE